MRLSGRIRLFAWTLSFLFAGPSPAQLINGDDLVLTDPTPDVVFDDTDSAGRTYRIRGFNEYFRIRYEPTMISIFHFDPTFQSTAVGYGATAGGTIALALGAAASAGSTNATAVGRLTDVSGSGGTALGFLAHADSKNSTALGAYTVATQAETIILGPIPGINFATEYADVGMGTSTPSQAVDVERSEAAARFQLTSYTSVSNEAPQYIQRRARGTRTAPSAVQANDNLGLFSFRGYTPGGFGGSRATITAQAAGTFSNSSTPTRLIFATTPVGQTAPQQVMVITPDGKVQVNGQNLTVPDYVFEDNYPLMPLEELRSFIASNGHLPGIASAIEVTEGGLDLAGSHLDHLRKIEELTLYTLEQELNLTELRDQNQKLQVNNDRLAERLQTLESTVARLVTER